MRPSNEEEHLDVSLKRGQVVPTDNPELGSGHPIGTDHAEFGGEYVDAHASKTEREQFAAGRREEEFAEHFGGEIVESDDETRQMSAWFTQALEPQIVEWLKARAVPEECASPTVEWLKLQGVDPRQLFVCFSLEKLIEMRKAKLPLFPMVDTWLKRYWAALKTQVQGR